MSGPHFIFFFFDVVTSLSHAGLLQLGIILKTQSVPIFLDCNFFTNTLFLIFDNFNFHVVTFVHLLRKISHGHVGKKWETGSECSLNSSVLGSGPFFCETAFSKRIEPSWFWGLPALSQSKQPSPCDHSVPLNNTFLGSPQKHNTGPKAVGCGADRNAVAPAGFGLQTPAQLGL